MTHRRLRTADGVSGKTLNAAREEIIMEKKPFVTREKLEEIAAKIPTPFYIYDEEGLRENIREIHKAFSWNPGFREYFAVKAEPNPVILSLLLEEGCGCDCSSMTELVMAKAVGCDGEHIMFSSNDTPDEEYVYADKIGAIVNLDDFTMIESYAKAVGKFPKTMCCRYNPGGIFKVSNGIMDTPGDAKYGMTTSQLFDAFRILKENGVENFGIHSFLVSNAVTNEYYPMLAKLLFELAVEVQRETGVHITFINLSGGIGIPYKPGQEKNDIMLIGEGVRKAYEDVLVPAGMGDIAIYTEMGRYVTGPYGALVGKENAPLTNMYDITGSLCENNDKFAIDRMLPKINMGDLLYIHDTGAHGFAMGYNYNGKLKSAEVLLHPDGTFEEIRRAERAEDYFATFSNLPIYEKLLSELH